MYVWVGKESVVQEKNAGFRNADKYIAALKDGRKKETIQIIEVEPTHEPPMFKVVFPNWSDNYAEKWRYTKAEQIAML